MNSSIVHPDGISPIFIEWEKRLPGYSYKLSQGGCQYGLDVAVGESEVDEKRKAITLVFADGNTRDGVGDVVDVSGIVLDRHRLNPIILLDHGKNTALPIAKAEDPETGQYTVEIDPVARVARAKAFFYGSNAKTQLQSNRQVYDHELLCDQIFDLWAKKYLRAGSIGYSIRAAKSLPPNYETGTPAGLYLQSVLMLEASVVVLPANQSTVAKMLAMPTICGKPKSEYLVKSLTPYAPAKTAQLGYELREGKMEKAEKDLVDLPIDNIPHTKIPNSRWKPGKGAVKELRQRIRQKRIGEQVEIVPIKTGGWTVLKAGTDEPIQHNLNFGTSEIARIWARNLGYHVIVRVRPNLVRDKAIIVKTKASDPKQAKVGKVLREFKEGKLRSGSGAKVTSRPQAIAIAMSESGQSNKKSLGCKCKECKSGKDCKCGMGNTKCLQGSNGGKPGSCPKDPPSSKPVTAKASKPKLEDEPLEDKVENVKHEKSLDFNPDAIETILNESGIVEPKLVDGPVGFLYEITSQSPTSRVAEVLKQAGYMVDWTAYKVRIKSLPQGNKDMASVHTKDMNPEPQVVEDEAQEVGQEQPAEMYGAQALRRIHEDHAILLEDYDGFLKHLEKPEVKQHIEELLSEIEDRMTKAEELFSSIDEYKDYPPIEGSMKKDMEEEETPEEEEEGSEEFQDQEESDKGDENETPPEDVVEGMKSKSLRNEKVKQLRTQLRQKGLGVEGSQIPGKEDEQKGPGKKPSDGKLGVESNHVPSKESDKIVAEKKPKDKLGVEGSHVPSKESDKIVAEKKQFPEVEKEDSEVEVTKKDLQAGNEQLDRVNMPHTAVKFMPYQRKAVKDASDYARELSETHEFGEEHRKKSYHHHKMLDTVADEMEHPGGMTDYGIEGGHEPGMESVHQKDFPEVEKIDNTSEVQMGMNPHVKTLRDASRHFKALSEERAFGEDHRKACLLAHKALDPIANMDEQTEVHDPNAEVDIVPGEMGEKILASNRKKDKIINDLDSKMKRLLALVS